MIGRGRCIPIAAAALVSCWALAGGFQSAAADEINLSPALPSDSDVLTFRVDVVAGFVSGGRVQVNGSQIVIQIDEVPLSPRPPGTLQHLVFNHPPLPAGAYTVTVDTGSVPPVGFTVRPQTAFLALGQRFLVTVTKFEPGATPTAVRLSDWSGYFWFFNAGDLELTVKIVDGRFVNNRFWVFVASMTDTPLAITVTDTSVQGCLPGGSGASACPAKTYSTTTRTNQNFIDVNAF